MATLLPKASLDDDCVPLDNWEQDRDDAPEHYSDWNTRRIKFPATKIVKPIVSSGSFRRSVIALWKAHQHGEDIRFSKTVEEEFDALAAQWESATRNISSPKAIASHPTVHKIIELGEIDNDIVPLILRRMSQTPWFWFSVLVTLTKENPITREMRGDMQQMTQAWLQWGENRGII